MSNWAWRKFLTLATIGFAAMAAFVVIYVVLWLLAFFGIA